MLFNSLSFIVFFTVFSLIYFALRNKLRLFSILLASIIFYSFFNTVGILILGGVVVFNFYSGVAMGKWKWKRQILIVSVAANIGLFFVFKYFDFFSSSLTDLLATFGVTSHLPILNLMLPVGISYYTLQSISYNVDIYHEVQEPEKDLLTFATCFFFFPKISMGPVERPRNLLPQLQSDRKVNYENITSGLKLIAWGLFKKAVIADRLSVLVDQVYDQPHNYTGLNLVIAGLFYTFQLYADFSGYMALGVAEIMGFKLMKNFNRPFASTSVTDFWKRWHISFSTWLYEYIYNPLSLTMRKQRVWGMVIAIMITFAISGLWHGARFTYLLWGVFNGIALSYEVATVKARKTFWKKISPATGKFICIAITFLFSLTSFTFSRAKDVTDGFYMIKYAILGLPETINKLIHHTINLHPGMTKGDFLIIIAAVILMELIQLKQSKVSVREWLMTKPQYFRWSLYYALIIVIIVFGKFNETSFIYIQF